MSGEIFAHKYKVIPGKAAPETQLTAGNYPASGSYVDVSGCERVHVLIHLGAVASGDTPTFEVKQAPAADGTPVTISATNCRWVGSGSSDNNLVLLTIETDKLAPGHRYVTLVASGTLNGTYADVLFLLPLTSEPVAQIEAICPPANQLAYVG
ncbi:MAG: hypothetical protein ACUVS6_13755 [Anaerolineae bacterium]